MDTECPVARQWFPTPVGLSRFVCSLNLWLSVLYVYMAAFDVTRDVIDGSTSVFVRCFVFRVYYHRAEGVHQLVVYVYVICYVTYKSGQAVLIILPRIPVVVPA